jgi:hypothetical protein
MLHVIHLNLLNYPYEITSERWSRRIAKLVGTPVVVSEVNFSGVMER